MSLRQTMKLWRKLSAMKLIAGNPVVVEPRWNATTNHKLRENWFQITSCPLPNLACDNREWEKGLTRLRIGHSNLTHGFLMERGHQPFCDDCLVHLTIKLILPEYPNYITLKEWHADLTMKYMFFDSHCYFNGKIIHFYGHKISFANWLILLFFTVK